MSEKLAIEQLGPVTQMTLNREEVANAIDAEMAVAIAATIDAFATHEEARVLVVTGPGSVPSVLGAIWPSCW